MARALVFLPTYNEADSIKDLIGRILEIHPEGGVLVVDDLSPDGTGRIVDEMAALDSRIQVVHRQGPRGRGYAGIAGLRLAGASTGFSHVIEMDADGSHDPCYIPNLLTAARDADVVLGSRYVPGGGVLGWGWFRVLNSAVANCAARLILGLPYHDATSGYRCFKRETLADLPWDSMISNNPSIVEEILVHLHRRKRRIIEIPIVFTDRTVGK
jgi:dolichol-phosphate mannosyltransferase